MKVYHKSSNTVFAQGRPVGRVELGRFTKNIKGSKHILSRPPSIALDVDSLRQAESMGAHAIVITDTETGLVYSCDLTHFKRFCFELNRGYGFQRSMTLDRWTVTGGNIPNNYPSRVDVTETTEYASMTEEAEVMHEYQLALFAES